MLIPIPLRWQQGFIGTDVPGHEVPGGCLLFENVRLSLNGISKRAIPGIRRRFFHRLHDLTEWPLDNGSKLVAFDAAAAFGFPGVGLAAVDWTLANPNRRVLALGVNRALRPDQFLDPRTGTAWNPTTEPVLVIDPSDFERWPGLGRMLGDEYPSILTAGHESFLHSLWRRPGMLRSGNALASGLRAPARKPVLTVAGDVNVIDDCGVTAMTRSAGLTDADLVVSLKSPTGVGSGNNPLDPFVFADEDLPVYDSGATGSSPAEIKKDLEYQRLWIKRAIAPGTDLAYRNTAATWGVGDSRARLGIWWMPAEPADGNRALDKFNGSTIPGGTFAIIVADGAALAGARKEVVITRELQAGIWTRLDEIWPGFNPAAPLGFAQASWGLRLLKTLPGGPFGAGFGYQIRIDRFERVKGFGGPFNGRWRARYTWFDPTTEPNVESDPSPESDEIDCGATGQALRLETAGFRGFWDTADNGFAGDAIGANRDELHPSRRVRVYYHTPSFLSDPTTGGRTYRLGTGPEGVA